VSAPRQPTRSRAGRRFAAGVAVVATLTVPGIHTGWAYFFGALRAADRGGWASESWGPGETLIWEVIRDPVLADHESFLGAVTAALETWDNVPTADIEWSLGGVVEGVAEKRVDGRNTIFIDPDTQVGGYASSTRKRHPDRPDIWETTECDIGLNPRVRDDPSAPVQLLIHELGHCLGLGHATRHGPFAPDPVMSYGSSRGLGTDDAIGGSLLRPAPGWIPRTGSVSGRVSFEGEPARFVAVGVIHDEDGRARRILDVLTDEQGQFVAEGLSPGEYVLWIHPISSQSAHPGPIAGGALLEMEDLLYPYPIPVRAGQETSGHQFSVRPGRLR